MDRLELFRHCQIPNQCCMCSHESIVWCPFDWKPYIQWSIRHYYCCCLLRHSSLNHFHCSNDIVFVIDEALQSLENMALHRQQSIYAYDPISPHGSDRIFHSSAYGVSSSPFFFRCHSQHIQTRIYFNGTQCTQHHVFDTNGGSAVVVERSREEIKQN